MNIICRATIQSNIIKNGYSYVEIDMFNIFTIEICLKVMVNTEKWNFKIFLKVAL
jgi:hypothetical protein